MSEMQRQHAMVSQPGTPKGPIIASVNAAAHAESFRQRATHHVAGECYGYMKGGIRGCAAGSATTPIPKLKPAPCNLSFAMRLSTYLLGGGGVPWLPLLLCLFVAVSSVAAEEFTYVGFSNAALTTEGSAHVDRHGILELTNTTRRLIGRAFHPQPVRMRGAAGDALVSFSTEFVVSIQPQYPTLGGHGIAFLMAPTAALNGELPSQYFGLFSENNTGKPSNHIFALELDTVRDFEFNDIDDNHVGLDINGLISARASTAAYINASGGMEKFDMKSQKLIRCWLNYASGNITVWLAPNDRARPNKPLISANVSLAGVLTDSVFVGFSSSTGLLSSFHRVLGWSFRTGGAPAPELNLSALPRVPDDKDKSPALATRFTVLVSVAATVLAVGMVVAGVRLVRRRRRAAQDEKMESWELEYGPHRFSYAELRDATRDFREQNVLGCGGFGRVYRGVLPGSGIPVAVKRISHESSQGVREFVAEIASMGRLRHRNLVQLQGWCRHRGDLMLVYDYMPNGSLDRYIFDSDSDSAGGTARSLSWPQRHAILRDVAAALVYLHEEWEQRVVHRDVKSSNVLLDADFSGRLGDFGLARLYKHDDNPHTTHVVGTLGYMAPELARTGKATTETDVFAFGALIMEVVCGRRPVDPKRGQEEVVLMDWLWDLQARGCLGHAVGARIAVAGYAADAVTVLHLGLWCSHPWPDARPSMRQAAQMLAGEKPVPKLPEEVPTPRTARSDREGYVVTFSDVCMDPYGSFVSQATSDVSAYPPSLLSGAR